METKMVERTTKDTAKCVNLDPTVVILKGKWGQSIPTGKIWHDGIERRHGIGGNNSYSLVMIDQSTIVLVISHENMPIMHIIIN